MPDLQEATPATGTALAWWQKNLKWFAPLLFFFLATAFYTYPLIFQFTTSVIGRAGLDRNQNLWNFWWIGQALTHRDNPYYTGLLFFPYYQPPQNPFPLYFHTLQVFNGAITLPLQWIGGLAAAFNVVVFGATLLSGLGTYLLVRRLGASMSAGFVAGAIYAFGPFRTWTIERSYTNIQSTEFLPFYAFFLLGADRPGLNKKMLLGAILTLSFCVYTDWYNTIYLLAYTAFYFGWKLLSQPRRWKQWTIWVALLGVGSFILTLPLVGPVLANTNNPAYQLVPGFDRDVEGSTNLAWLFLPNPATRGANGLMGYIGVLLALVTLASLFGRQQGRNWLSRAGRAYWLILAALALVLSLGPELQITKDWNTNFPLPYALLRYVPLVSITNYPDRFVILATLAIAALAAFAVDWLRLTSLWTWLISRPALILISRQKLANALLVGLLLALVLLENWQPMPTFAYQHNAFIEALAKEPGDFNLLELPLVRQYRLFNTRMYNQVVHGRPILGGYLSRLLSTDPYRTPDSAFKPVADLVLRKNLPPDIIRLNSNAEDLDDLVNLYNFRYILLYLDAFTDAPQRDGVIDLIETHYGKQQLIYQDEEMRVYRVPDAYLAKQARPVHTSLGAGWYPVEQEGQDRWRWANASSYVYTFTPVAQKVQLEIKLRPFDHPRTLQVQLNKQAAFQVKVPDGPATTFTFETTLPAGRTEIGLVSLEGDQSPHELDAASQDNRRLAFAVHSVQIR